MQISRISAQSFGCRQCGRTERIKNNKNNDNDNQLLASKPVAVSRNALIATLVGVLASCQTQDCDGKYYFGMTPEGNPYILNQDGDTIDVIPRCIEDDYNIYCEKKNCK